ncbi:MAG: recombination mediator protein UvsY [bacterium]
MDADEDLIKSASKIDYYQTMLSYLESILKTILNRTYQIKNAIEYMRFTAGYG